jgi:hypothetical protein
MPIQINNVDIQQLLNDTMIGLGNQFNPIDIILSGGGTTTSSIWTRSSIGVISPITITDKVGLGTTTFIGNERLRILGETNTDTLRTTTGYLDELHLRNNSSYLAITAPVTTSRTITFQDKDGIVALLSDTQSLSNYDLLITYTQSNASIVNAVTLAHTHTNKSLLDTYTQTEVNLASAVSLKHTHANKSLLDTYNQTNASITSAITNSHTHTNKNLLDTYDQTNTDIISAITNQHEHTNFSLLETYTQTDADILLAITDKHSHTNKELLDTYTQTDVNIIDAVGKKHIHANFDLLETYTQTEVDLNSAVVRTHLHANKTILDSIINSGDGTLFFTDAGDYRSANISSSGSDTQILFNDIGIIVGNAALTFTKATELLAVTQIATTNITVDEYLYLGNTSVSLTKDGGGNLVFEDELNTSTTLTELLSGGSSIFQSPDGYTATTATVGGIISGTLVGDLNGHSTVEVLQMALFPTPASPIFVNPTESIILTIGTPTNFNVLYVIKGSSSAMTIVDTFTSGNGPGGKPYALIDGSPIYTVNTAAFSNGDTILFDGSTYTFKADQDFIANGTGEADPEFVVLGSGITVYAEDYTGYTPGTVSGTKIYTTVDPTYYGAFTVGTSDYDTVPTWSEITTGAIKLISVEPTTLSISITTYSGSVDTHKYIVIAYPDSYGTLSHIYYVEGGNNDVIGSFLNTTETYTRPDSTTVTYRIYYALNSYAGEDTPRTLHYTVTF